MEQNKNGSRHSRQATLLGDLLKEGRTIARISQHNAAHELGVSRPYLSKLERGIYDHPSPQILARAAKLYGLRLADLYVQADYTTPDELPTFANYLRVKHPGIPDEAIQRLEQFYRFIKQEFSID